MEAKLYGQNKGGTSINGIIKDYYVFAKGRVEAGDLVEYVNGVAGKTDYGESVDTSIIGSSNAAKTCVSALKIDENRVFLTYCYTSSGDNYGLRGIIATVDGATITKGTSIQIDSTGGCEACSAVLLPDGNIFVAYDDGSSEHYLYARILAVEGTTLSYKAIKQLSTASGTAHRISTVLLPNGNVFIAHSYGGLSNTALYGLVCTISGTTITMGTDTELGSKSNYAGYAISTCLLPNGNVFIAHSYSSNYYLYGMVVSISGTTITKGTDTALVSSTKAGYVVSAVTLINGNVFIAHSYSASMYLYKMVVSISGTTITKGTDLTLGPANDGHAISTCLLPNGNVFVASSYDTDYYLRGRIVSGAGTELSYSTLIKSKYAGSKISSLLLNNGTIFIAHSDSSSYYLNAQIWGVDENNTLTNRIIADEYETQVRKVTTGLFDGVAKTSGVGGDDTGHNEVVKVLTFKSKVLSGVFPLTLEGSEGKKLINYKIEGNTTDVGSVGDKTNNLWSFGNLNTTRDVNKTFDVNLNGTYTIGFELDYESYANTGGSVFQLTVDGRIQYMAAASILQYGSKRAKTTFTGNITQIKFINWCGLVGDVIKIQLEEGSDLTDYQPSGYKIPIKTNGKNLLNIPDTIVEGTNSWATISVGDYELAPGEYTISAFYNKLENDKPTCALSVREYGATSPLYCEIIGTQDSGRLTGKLTVPEGSKGIRIYAYSNLTGTVTHSKVKFYNFQIEKGTVATDYEPYLLTNIYLNEPLRKTDDYADYIDFATKKLVRKVNGEITEETITLPSIPTIEGTTILESYVSVQPSNVEVQYMIK